MHEPAVVVDSRGAVLTVTLNRPHKRNALDAEALCRLRDAWHRVDSDDTVRVVLLSGRGAHFCAGMDLGALERLRAGTRSDEWTARLLDDPRVIFDGLLKTFRPAKPVVCAVEGVALGGGTEILLGTDVRVAATGARLGLTEVRRGLFPMGGSAVRLPRQIGYAAAAEMLLTGEEVPAVRAHELGLVSRLAPDGGSLQEAADIAARIARNGPLAVRAILATMREAENLPEPEGFAVDRRLGTPVMRSKDAAEGTRAFLERREPEFSGE